MLRSLLVAVGAAAILVAILSWQNIMSAGVSQMASGWEKLSTYYNQEPIRLPGVITDEAQLKPLIPKMIEANVGLMNSPYPETQTERSQLTRRDGECEGPRANLDEVAFFLRSNLFEPLEPIAIHHARDAKLPPDLVQFFQDYGGGAHKLTTNSAGERTTTPMLEMPRKVLVAGDSAAFGPMLDDSATLTSRLQAKDSTRQYINVGVPGGSSEQVLCHLTKAVSKYQGQVEELIYLHSEDDFAADQRFGTPDAVINAVKSLAQSGTTKVTMVYVPSLYNVVPELTRYNGYAGERAANPQAEREQLRKNASEAGFAWLDMGDIVLERSRSLGNAFSAFDSFADPRSLSAQGISILVDKFTLPVPPETLALAAAAPSPKDQVNTGADFEYQLRKQSAALDDIRAAAARAAKNNRLKREVGDILKKLKNELAEGQ